MSIILRSAREGVNNYLPNSSFECGTAGWGSYNPEMRTWAGNVFRLIGEIDEQTAFHGKRSMRVESRQRESTRFHVGLVRSCGG